MELVAVEHLPRAVEVHFEELVADDLVVRASMSRTGAAYEASRLCNHCRPDCVVGYHFPNVTANRWSV